MYLIVLIVVVVIGVIFYLEEKAFCKIFLKKRRSKEEMIECMKTKDKFNYDDWSDVKFDDIFIKSKEGFKLKGYLHKGNSDKFIIIHHGYSANHYVCYQFLEVFLNDDYNILLVDMRNHGDSEGDFISYGYFEVDDLDRWVECLKSNFGNDIKIGLHGQSMGASIVLMYAARFREKIKFVIEDCGYKSAKDVIAYQCVEVNNLPFQPFFYLINLKCRIKYKFNLLEVSPIDEIKGVEIPILFIHGTGDTLIPFKHALDMYDAHDYKHDKLFIVEKAQHVGACSIDRDKYSEVIKNFIKDKI